MTRSRLTILWLFASLAGLAGNAAAAPVQAGGIGRDAAGAFEPVRLAEAGCASAAAQAAAETGGQVLSVTSRQQDGRTVCIVTVLVPGEDGGRPRKRTLTLPQ